MTQQFSDIVRYEDRDWQLVGVRGGSPFDPATLGLELTAISTALWRGSLVTYEVVDDRLVVASMRVSRAATWHGEGVVAAAERAGIPTAEGLGMMFRHCVDLELHRPCDWSGDLLIAHTPAPERPPHMGFPTGWLFDHVLDLQVADGVVTGVVDRSAQLGEVRRRILAGELPHPDGDRSDIDKWISRSFTLDYARSGL